MLDRKPRTTVKLPTVCKEAGVDKNVAETLFGAIADNLVRGNVVLVVGFGKFWVAEATPGKRMIPVFGGSKQLRPIKLDRLLILRFRATEKMKEMLRALVRGRARGMGH